MSATMFDALFSSHASPVLTELFGESVVDWKPGDARVTAVQLATGASYSDAMFHESESMPAEDGNVGNVLNATLWLPITARPKPQDQWLIIHSDGRQTEFTVTTYGAQSGGRQQVKLVKTTVTRFKSAGKLT